MKKTQKIVWLVDPLSPNLEQASKILTYFSCLSQRQDVSIFPLYVYGSEIRTFKNNLDMSLEKIRESEIRLSIENLIPKDLRSFFEKPTILNIGSTSVQEDITAVVDYLDQSNVDSVVINTSNKKDFTTFWVGSFTKHFLKEASLPVLLFSPHTEYTGLESILVISNFLKHQKKVISNYMLKNILSLTKNIHLLCLLQSKKNKFDPTEFYLYSVNLDFEKDLTDKKNKMLSDLKNLITLITNKIKVKTSYSISTEDFINSIIDASKSYKPDITLTVIDKGVSKAQNDPTRVLEIAQNVTSPILIIPNSSSKI